MEFSTGRLEASRGVQERPCDQDLGKDRRRAPHQDKGDAVLEGDDLMESPDEGHQLNDLA